MTVHAFEQRPAGYGRYGVLAIGIAGLAMAGVFYKLATAPVLTIVAYRMLMSVALMLPLLLLSRRSAAGQRSARFERGDVVATALSGVLFAADVGVWAASLQFTSVSSAALLVSMDPIFVAAFGALFLRERPTLFMIAGMAVAACGAVIITTGDVRASGRALIGDGLALCAAFAETGYLLIGRHVRQRVDTLRYATLVYATCAVTVWLALAGFRISPAIGAHDLVVCLALALVATVLGHTLVSRSLGHMPAVVVAVAFLSQPIMTASFAWLFLRQTIPALTALGGIIALVGIGIVAYANERTVAAGPPAGI